MKLGLLYREIGHGTGESLPVINNGGWNVASNFISEFGKILSYIGIPIGDVQTIGIGFKYIPGGQLICLVRRMEVRGDSSRSNQALWIFIPSSVILNEGEMNQLVSSTAAMFSNPMVFSNPQRFLEAVPDIYKTDFPGSPYPVATGNMAGEKVAVVPAVGENAVSRILDLGYQRAYDGYGLILLSPSGVAAGGVPKIDPSSLHKNVFVNWPAALPINLQGPTQLSITVDRRPLGAQGLMLVEGPHEVVLQWPGFEPVAERIMVSAENHGKPLVLGQEWKGKQWLRRVDVKNWKIVNERNTSLLKDCEFTSSQSLDRAGNVKPTFRATDEIFVNARNLKNFEVQINVPGYEKADRIFDLTSTQPMAVTMRKLPEEPVIVGGHSDTAGHGGYGNRDNFGHNERNNIGGRNFNNDIAQISTLKNKLEKERKEKNTWRLVALIASVAAILFLILWLVKGKDSHEGNNSVNENSEYTINSDNQEGINEDSLKKGETESNEGMNSTTEDNSLGVAISYLENHDNWEFKEMAKYPDLNGLYNDLNTFNWGALTNKWADVLKESEKYQKILDEAKKNADKHIVPIEWGGRPMYNSPGDETISVTNYANYISELVQGKFIKKNNEVKNEQPARKEAVPQQKPVKQENVKEKNASNPGKVPQKGLD